MNDPVRTAILARYGVDDPESARQLSAPRLRFTLAAGPAPMKEAVDRACALAATLTPPVQVRVVAWREPERARLPAQAQAGWQQAPTDEGVERHVCTFLGAGSDPAIAELIALSLHGGFEIHLWLLDAEGRLLRPYDDRGADVVAPTPAALDTFALRYPTWVLEDLR